MSEELTPWFPGDVEPSMVGVYLRLYDEGPHYSYWDGRDWSYGFSTAGIAGVMGQMGNASPHQYLKWRGLAKEPKA